MTGSSKEFHNSYDLIDGRNLCLKKRGKQFSVKKGSYCLEMGIIYIIYIVILQKIIAVICFPHATTYDSVAFVRSVY